MGKEYEILRSEMMDNIHKQETINNSILSILGLSFVLTSKIESYAFIVFILFFSAVLLAKVQQCREVVYYISTYLSQREKNDNFEVRWEYNLTKFRSELKRKRNIWSKKEYFAWMCVRTGALVKNFGILGLVSFLLVKLWVQMWPSEVYTISEFFSQADNGDIIVCILSSIFYIMNLYFTLVISFDRKLRSAYTKVWEIVLSSEDEESVSSGT